jgi:hypothetical protein
MHRLVKESRSGGHWTRCKNLNISSFLNGNTIISVNKNIYHNASKLVLQFIYPKFVINKIESMKRESLS